MFRLKIIYSVFIILTHYRSNIFSKVDKVNLILSDYLVCFELIQNIQYLLNVYGEVLKSNCIASVFSRSIAWVNLVNWIKVLNVDSENVCFRYEKYLVYEYIVLYSYSE